MSIDPGFICCWLDVKRIVRSKPLPTTNGHCWRATRIGSGPRDTIHMSLVNASTPLSHYIVCVLRLCVFIYIVYIYIFYVHMMQCAVVELLLEVIIFCFVATVTPRHATTTTPAPQPVCYVRRGNLLLPSRRLLFRTKRTGRFSPVSRWEAFLTRTRVEFAINDETIVKSID